jgi:glycosyltransferase involved in cell wall biosynthesis
MRSAERRAASVAAAGGRVARARGRLGRTPGSPGTAPGATAGDKLRLLVVSTHPIQYQVPLYRHLAASDTVQLQVGFLTDFGVKSSFDPGFGRQIAYDIPLTDGYDHSFLSTGNVEYPGRWSVPWRPLLCLLSPQRWDAVVVQGYSTLAAWATCLVAQARGIPYLMRGETQLLTDQARPAWRRRLKRLVLGPLLRRAGACLAIGSDNARFYASYGVARERIVVAPYSVDTEFFAASGHEGRERRVELLGQVGLDPTLPTVCLAAKLQPYKRPLDVLAAVARMRQRVNLLLIGEGPLRREVEAQAQRLPSARVLGFVNQSEIGQWYGASEVIVLSSSWEPWGLVINEAMATGAVPVVSSAVGCGADLVRPGHGATFPVGDVAALTQVLEGVLSRLADPQALAAARLRSRAISDELSIAATAGGYEAGVALACGRLRQARATP